MRYRGGITVNGNVLSRAKQRRRGGKLDAGACRMFGVFVTGASLHVIPRAPELDPNHIHVPNRHLHPSLSERLLGGYGRYSRDRICPDSDGLSFPRLTKMTRCELVDILRDSRACVEPCTGPMEFPGSMRSMALQSRLRSPKMMIQ